MYLSTTFFFWCFVCSCRMLSASIWCLMEEWNGEQRSWGTQHGPRSKEALNPHPSKSSLAAAPVMVNSRAGHSRFGSWCSTGLAQWHLPTGRSCVPVINWKDWANLGLSVLAPRNHIACPHLPLLLAWAFSTLCSWGEGMEHGGLH